MNCVDFYLLFVTQVIMIEEQNGNNPINVKLSSSTVVPIASSQSNDDLSLSTSEYTDADEMSAPTEYLAEVSGTNPSLPPLVEHLTIYSI